MNNEPSELLLLSFEQPTSPPTPPPQSHTFLSASIESLSPFRPLPPRSVGFIQPMPVWNPVKSGLSLDAVMQGGHNISVSTALQFHSNFTSPLTFNSFHFIFTSPPLISAQLRSRRRLGKLLLTPVHPSSSHLKPISLTPSGRTPNSAEGRQVQAGGECLPLLSPVPSPTKRSWVE